MIRKYLLNKTIFEIRDPVPPGRGWLLSVVRFLVFMIPVIACIL